MTSEQHGDVHRLPVDPDAEEGGTPEPGAVPAHVGGWDVALVVACGGAIGGSARYALNSWWPSSPDAFPWATLVENVSGCLLLGALMVVLLESYPQARYLRPFLAVGVLGGYTTFSAYSAETLALLQHGAAALALLNLAGSVAAGVLAAWAGIATAEAVVRRRTTARAGAP